MQMSCWQPKELGRMPANCIVFEDAESGVDAALAAGMMCLGVGDGKTSVRQGGYSLLIMVRSTFTPC